MKILISGGRGVIGSYLVPVLERDGHEIWMLTRKPEGVRDIGWEPSRGEIDGGKMVGFDAVVHLAGENIGEGRWTEAQKRKIIDSRKQGTALISQAILKCVKKPSVLVSASAIGYYPSDRDHDEDSPAGTSFLAGVCKMWEAETQPVKDAGIRVVHPRIGMMLTCRGGPLPKLLPAFRSGMGGSVGTGTQKISWVHPADVVAVLRLMITDERFSGPYNVVAPEPTPNRVFAEALCEAVGKPPRIKVPEFAVRAMYGEMGEATILTNFAIVPKRLKEMGYTWFYPELRPALQNLLAEGC